LNYKKEINIFIGLMFESYPQTKLKIQ